MASQVISFHPVEWTRRPDFRAMNWERVEWHGESGCETVDGERELEDRLRRQILGESHGLAGEFHSSQANFILNKIVQTQWHDNSKTLTQTQRDYKSWPHVPPFTFILKGVFDFSVPQCHSGICTWHWNLSAMVEILDLVQKFSFEWSWSLNV